MGGSVSNQMNQDKAYSSNQQKVWGPQGEALQGLYGAAANLYGNQPYAQNYGDQIQGLSDQMQGYAGQAAGGMERMLGGGAVGDTTQLRQNLMDSLQRTATSPTNTSRMYQSIVGGPGNEYIDPMVAAMKQGGMDNLSRMQAQSGLGAAAAGQGGSSRHAMQNAMLGAEANQDMLAQEANMRGGAYDKDLAMKMNIAGLADQNVQSSQQRMMDLLGASDTNVQAGMSYAPQAQGLGMGTLAPYQSTMNNYANVIGGPQVLSGGRSNASSWGHSGSFSGGMGGGK